MIEITQKVYLPGNKLAPGVKIYFKASIPDASKSFFQPNIILVNNAGLEFFFKFYGWAVPIDAVRCKIYTDEVFELMVQENRAAAEETFLDLVFRATIKQIVIHTSQRNNCPECELTFIGGCYARSREDYDSTLDEMLVY